MLNTSYAPEDLARALRSACGACAAQPNNPCRDLSDLANPKDLSYFHDERLSEALDVDAIESGTPDRPRHELTDALIDATGLF